MQYGFNPGELLAARVEKASDRPEIYVIVRKFVLQKLMRISGQISRTYVAEESDLLSFDASRLVSLSSDAPPVHPDREWYEHD